MHSPDLATTPDLIPHGSTLTGDNRVHVYTDTRITGFPSGNRVATGADDAAATNHGRGVCEGGGTSAGVYAGRSRDPGIVRRTLFFFFIYPVRLPTLLSSATFFNLVLCITGGR